ncbi:MAG: hypothetical protein ACHRXM_29180 [Isosphaerales bacterium]
MTSRSRGRTGATASAAIGSSAPPAGGAARDRRAGESGDGPSTKTRGQGTWPGPARVAVSLALMFHLAAVLAGALGVPPSSMLERTIADLFLPYYDLVDAGYSYRFYAEPSPTPVVTATLRFGDRRPEETVRLPGREVAGPRMRHQRQLALANALFMNVQEARQRTGDGSQSRLARAYARHLCASRPDCRMVTLHLQQHLIPDLDEVREAISAPGAPRFDLFAESLLTTPEWIGDYPCDGF